MRVWSSLPPERFILKAYVGWLDEDYEAANTLQPNCIFNLRGLAPPHTRDARSSLNSFTRMISARRRSRASVRRNHAAWWSGRTCRTKCFPMDQRTVPRRL